ncbi:MAG: amino acid adenylation domain-containing protein [Planctomycetaceae bacterium]|nr:amino acid adenylation domain-containing protein [Planctomycetaceae bacterium]
MSSKRSVSQFEQLSSMSAEEKRQLLAELLAEQESTKSNDGVTPSKDFDLSSGSPSPGSLQRFPLSPAQQRLWFIDQLQPGLTVYTIPAALRWSGDLNVPVLQRCLDEIVSRHEILRARFVAEGGTPWQVFDQQSVFSFEESDEISDDALCQFFQKPFDLANGPLLRVRLGRDLKQPADHILLIAIHHIVADYWSLRILMRELMQLYGAHLSESPVDLPNLKVQYADYAAWQNDQQQQLEDDVHYWKRQLADMPTLLKLPTDFSRPVEQSFQGQRVPFRLSRELSEALAVLAKEEETTLFVTLLTAVQTVMYRHSGQDDFCIGSTVTNRDRAEVRDLIGLFVNNVVFRARFAPMATFRDQLQQTHEAVLGGLRHQKCPFERIVDALHVDRQMSHNALFQVAFVLRTEQQSQADWGRPFSGNISLAALDSQHYTAPFDLSIDVSETVDGLAGFLEYRTDLFQQTTIQRLAEHLTVILEEAVRDRGVPIDHVVLFQPAERERLDRWNATSIDIPDRSVQGLIEDQVVRTPDAIALRIGEQYWTYRELNEQANQLAHYLQSIGCGDSKPIAICLNRTTQEPANIVSSILAILKVGAHYLPLDPCHPADRIQDILTDADARFVLTDGSLPVLEGDGESGSQTFVNLLAVRDAIASQSTSNIVRSTTTHDLAYLIYTSGTTGRPKGVPIKNQSLVNLLVSMASRPGLTADDSMLAITTIAFDIATLELLLPLLVGAQLVVADEVTVTDGELLAKLISDAEITVMQGTPATWRLLIESGWTGCSSLKVLCGGEALDLSLARRLLQSVRELWNMYGPTETTIWSGALRISENSLAHDFVPIGGPIANTGFYVCDSQGNPLPIGVAGELFISGMGLSPGYRLRDRLTAQKFQNTSDGRQYATGDRVRYRDDGTIEFLGRLDHQIKLRGFRIEPGEIESKLNEHHSVDAVLVQVQDGDYQKLVAYVRSAEAASRDFMSELRQFLAARVPTYMVPDDFVVLDQFPLNANGKIDRALLPKPKLEKRDLQPLNSSTERTLASMWQDLLPLPLATVEDSFFDLGGHSLLAVRMIARVRDEFEVEMPLRSVFDFPRLSQLAARIDECIALSSNASSRSRFDIPPRPKDSPLVLTHAQRRQWILSQLDPDNPAYNIPAAIRIQGGFDRAQLEAGVLFLCQRHEVLQMAFQAAMDGTACLELQTPQAPFVEFCDVSLLPEAERRKHLDSLLSDQASKVFDLSRAPLMRILIVKVNDREHIVLTVLHHIVGDAWSLRLLMNELFEFVQRCANSSSIEVAKETFAPLPIQYSDYACFEQGQDKTAGQDYWKQQLADAPPWLDLPTDFTRRSDTDFPAGTVDFQLNARQRKILERISQEHDATMFMTILTVFNVLLHRYSQASDIIIGSPVGHRPNSQLERVVGLFVNTLAFRNRIDSNDKFSNLLDRVRATVLDGLNHQDVPFEEVVGLLDAERNWRHSPLFQVMFLWQSEQASLPSLSARYDDQRVSMGPYPLEARTAKFDLTLSMAEEGSGIVGQFEYRSDLFGQATIDSLVASLLQLVDAIGAVPDCPLGRLPITGPSQQRALQVVNHTEAEFSDGECLHERFETQVALTPDAKAVFGKERELTYAELNCRANQLAHQLRLNGVGPEGRVGICCDRNTHLVAAVMAVLKAGGAYVPIDPNYPTERIDFMLRDAGVDVVITETKWRHLFAAETTLVTDSLDSNFGQPVTGVDDENLETRVCPANAAYVIYTSGSTGIPKGVTLEHRNAMSLVDWAQTIYTKKELSGVLASTSICFDLSAFELFVPLCTGGAIVLAENALELPDLADASAVSLVNTVPSTAAELVRAKGIPASVVTINIAGEPLAKQLVRDLYATESIQAVYNLYGPSEDTTYSTFARMVADESGATSPIGHPVANTKVYVLDEFLELVPPGMVGELYLAGDGVARGYWNRPQLTAEAFLPNPFQPTGQPIYKTGDRVRLRHDGMLEFLGRIDDQIKLRGFRIELGELEQVLEQHPTIRHAAAAIISRKGSRDSQLLVAYVVNNDKSAAAVTLSPTSATYQDLLSFLSAKLPGFMIPASIVQLAELPRLPNGKLARGRLPTPDDFVDDFLPATPQTDTEVLLLSIWKELIGNHDIGIYDNFFSLGGDSIVALQVIAKAKGQGLTIGPRDFFEFPTVAALAKVAQWSATNEAEQEAVLGNVPLSPAQRWFFELPLEHRHHWNQSLLLEVKESLDCELLEKTLWMVGSHHDVLRASFQKTSAGWRQSFHPPQPTVPLEVITTTVDCGAEFIRDTADKVQAAFDLGKWPLWRVIYFNLTTPTGPVRRLLVVCHHLIVDGVSWRILLADLEMVYRQLSQTGKAQLPPKSHSLRTYLEHLKSNEFESEREYWLSLEKQPTQSVPLDYATGRNLMGQAKSFEVKLSREKTRRLLSEVPRKYNVRMEELLVAALSRTLGDWMQQANVKVQLEGHGRIVVDNQMDVSRTVGWLTSFYPVILPAEVGEGLSATIKQTKEAVRSVPSQGVGYSIRRWCHDNNSTHAGLAVKDNGPEIRFNYLGQVDQFFNSSKLFAPSHESTGTARHPDDPRDVVFEINALVAEERLVIHWIYGTELHSPETIHRLASRYRKEMSELIEFCLRSDSDAGYTETDFPQMDLEPGELDDLLKDLD